MVIHAGDPYFRKEHKKSGNILCIRQKIVAFFHISSIMEVESEKQNLIIMPVVRAEGKNI